MTVNLEREGIFKARVVGWAVKSFDSGSVALNLRFLVLSELDGEEWLSWESYEDHYAYGDFFVIKKDQTVNGKTVERLVQVLGWDGTLSSVVGKPPAVTVQIEVKAEEYKGETRYKVAWLNPEGYQSGGFGEDAATVKQLDARFGSLLRAAASGARQAAGTKPKPPAPKRSAPAPQPKATVPPSDNAEPPHTDDGRPMVQNPVSGEWEPAAGE